MRCHKATVGVTDKSNIQVRSLIYGPHHHHHYFHIHIHILKTPSTSTNSMEPYTITASRLLQVRKIFETILARLKRLIYSMFHTQILVYPHLEVQDASSGSVESTCLALEDALMTRHDSITCQSTNISTDDLDFVPLLLAKPPNPRCHVQSDGNKYPNKEILEEAFSDDRKLELVVPEYDHTALRYHLSNVSEEPELFKDSATALSWPSDIAPPPLTMWHQSTETVASFDCIDKVQTEDTNFFADTLCSVSSVVIDTSEDENSDQDTEDARLCVVITPPDNSWETSCYTAYNNRIGPQHLACLVVPPFYQFTSRLAKYEERMSVYHPLTGIVSHDQPAATPCMASLAFSLSGFQKHLQDTTNDKFNCYTVTALQHHQLKAVAFTASLRACLFRMRYDTPGFLENIEPRFKWIDPAEILIESFRHTPQNVTIYTSYRPCSVPHIVIHESPPNDPYVVWSNLTDSQNYRCLTIPSSNPSLCEKDDCQMADDDYLTDASSSLCDSSTPATPKDFSSTLEQELDLFFGEDIYETQNSNNIYQRYEDEFVVPQCSGPQSRETTFPSNPKFFIPDDDEEDSLPPLDDWYISIANRCMLPEEAEAVVAAAAAVSVSCH